MEWVLTAFRVDATIEFSGTAGCALLSSWSIASGTSSSSAEGTPLVGTIASATRKMANSRMLNTTGHRHSHRVWETVNSVQHHQP